MSEKKRTCGNCGWGEIVSPIIYGSLGNHEVKCKGSIPMSVLGFVGQAFEKADASKCPCWKEAGGRTEPTKEQDCNYWLRCEDVSYLHFGKCACPLPNSVGEETRRLMYEDACASDCPCWKE